MGRRVRQEGASCPLLHTAVYCCCVPFGAAQQAPGGILPGTDPIIQQISARMCGFPQQQRNF